MNQLNYETKQKDDERKKKAQQRSQKQERGC
jgi:hypothetical protein